MRIDANKLRTGKTLRADVCIIGAGVAGICVARELVDSGLQVILVESGNRLSRLANPASEIVVPEESEHLLPGLNSRRAIGGTSTVWGGRCVPFSELDFERRDYIPDSGWPISFDDLLPFYERANEYCEAGAFDYTVAGSLGRDAGEMIPGFRSHAVLTSEIERFSYPTDFGRRYAPLLNAAPNVRLVFNATCTHISLHQSGRYVDTVTLQNAAGKPIGIGAKITILAAGTLQATRLLLASNDVVPAGIGNHSGQLGRHYMSHMEGTVGELRLLTRDVVWNYERTRDGVYARRRMTISPETQRELRIGSFVAQLHHPNIVDPSHHSGILSAAFLTKRSIGKMNSFEKRTETQLRRLGGHLYLRHLGNVVTDLPRLLLFSQAWTRKRILAQRKLPSLEWHSRDNVFPLYFNSEQAPNPDSRVTLTPQQGRFNVPKIKVDWRMTDQDLRTIRKAMETIRDEVRSTGCGELVFNGKSLEEQSGECTPVGGHVLGTARMSASPSTGVVDPDCKVHGIKNLYVVGGAVFPTGGHANPVLTIAALAIRLADHLKPRYSMFGRVLESRPAPAKDLSPP